MNDITIKKIETINDSELSVLKQMLDSSFASTKADCPEYEKDMPVPNGDELMDSIKKGLDVIKLYYQGELVGGAVLDIHTETQRNTVELLFISAVCKGKGVGTLAWQTIEKEYPETIVWELGTPYFLKRNIHFYVNKCGFAVSKYYCKWNPTEHDGVKDGRDFFWFEKKMK